MLSIEHNKCVVSLTESFMGNTISLPFCSFCTLTFGVYDDGFASKDATSLHLVEKSTVCDTIHCTIICIYYMPMMLFMLCMWGCLLLFSRVLCNASWIDASNSMSLSNKIACCIYALWIGVDIFKNGFTVRIKTECTERQTSSWTNLYDSCRQNKIVGPKFMPTKSKTRNRKK